MKPITTNILYFGDNLDILRQHIADESIDLIYLDPPKVDPIVKTPKVLSLRYILSCSKVWCG
jgi:16S rRNA G966 N2-methylase RsmD